MRGQKSRGKNEKGRAVRRIQVFANGLERWSIEADADLGRRVIDLENPVAGRARPRFVLQGFQALDRA